MLPLLGILAAVPGEAQTQKPDLPDPIKFFNTFDVVANTVRAVLLDMEHKIELDDRKSGKIVTRPYEIITGSLTASEVEKVAVRNAAITGILVKARYSVDAIIEIVSPSETLVTIHTTIQALSREVDGTEKWVALDSLGTYERRILGRVSTRLMSNRGEQEERKGFWGQKPKPVDPRQPRLPSMPSR